MGICTNTHRHTKTASFGHRNKQILHSLTELRGSERQRDGGADTERASEREQEGGRAAIMS